MNISGKDLYKKVRTLRPELSYGITADILSKICEEPSVQPFLQWFCENVSHANVLSNDEIEMKSKLQNAGEWLEGAELDRALEEATRDCPDLLKLPFFDNEDTNDLLAEYEILKKERKTDEEYIRSLKNSLQNLKEVESKLDDDIEEAETLLEKDNIDADKAYYNCSMILNKFDNSNREFFQDIECLLNTYADGAENKGNPVVWTQVPLELFAKQMELYNHYIGVYIKRHFENTVDKGHEDSDYASLINESKERCIDEIIQELMSLKTNLTNAKIDEVIAIAQEKSCFGMLEYAQDIFNNGNLKVPMPSVLRAEILELDTKRNLLEENVTLLREFQLVDVVQQFAELETTKILKYDAQTKLERRRDRLAKLKNLRFLVREHGHGHADLLCMLMEMQFHSLKDITEFLADARHYLATEYSLSSARCESTQQQQKEYAELLSAWPKTYNSFDKLFVSMMCGSDFPCELNSALDKYNDTIAQNKEKKRYLFETSLKTKINQLQSLEDDVHLHYASEIQEGPTYNFKSVPYDVITSHDKAIDNLQKVQTDLTKIRNEMKKRVKENVGLKRERDILWQRFLADPDILKEMYQEAKQKANESHFGTTFEID